MDSENKIAETMRSIENMWRLFYENQISRNLPTLDEDTLGFKRVINNIAEHAVQSQLKDDHHHHPGRHNTGVKSSKEDETVHAHHRSVANPVSNGKLHPRQSNDQMVNRRTQVKNEPKQHGNVRNFFGGVVGHFLGSNKSKPSTADKRRLERTVTGKRNVAVKKVHWLEKIQRRLERTVT
ncbi:hypothetical protein C5167_018966, partial [Papaver somniferum]